MAVFVQKEMQKNGVFVKTHFLVKEVEEANGKAVITGENGEKVPCDMAVCAIGVLPESALAAKAGIKTGIKNCITVNEHLETSEKDIYACGDAVSVVNSITKKQGHIPLAGPAAKQGRMIADNICGIKAEYKGCTVPCIIKVFGITAAAVGINEETAVKNGIEYEKIVLSPLSNASYYPGSAVMTMKLLCDKNTFDILGVQIVGTKGVDKRIDVISTAIKAGLKAYDLKDLDLCYAPPYSSAKDPVNMAGFIMDNVKNGVVRHIHAEDIKNAGDDVFLLDTRTKGEFERGHACGFYNIPVDSLRERLSELPMDKKIYVMCQSGLRSYIATRILTENGFDAYNYSGGYRFYSQQQSKDAYPCGMEKK